MLLAAFLLVAVTDSADAEIPAPIAAPPHVYLHPPTDACENRAASDEVVVCANKDRDRYRLKPEEGQVYADSPIRAETQVAGGTLGLTANRLMLGGASSNRVMLNFKIKF